MFSQNERSSVIDANLGVAMGVSQVERRVLINIDLGGCGYD